MRIKSDVDPNFINSQLLEGQTTNQLSASFEPSYIPFYRALRILQIKMIQASINRRSKVKDKGTNRVLAALLCSPCVRKFVLVAALLWSIPFAFFLPFKENVYSIIVDSEQNLRKSDSALNTNQTSPHEQKDGGSVHVEAAIETKSENSINDTGGSVHVEAAIGTKGENSSDTGGSVPIGDFHFANTRSNTNRPDGLKGRVMLYITTHMSPTHIWSLKSCWPPALQNSPLLNSADVVVYLNTKEEERKESMTVLKRTFRDQDLTIHIRDNPGYQEGAMAALSDATKKGWFSGYDWVIRVNPDVIIRDSTFMLDVMQNDPNATALLINCLSPKRELIHTDFLAIKPEVLPQNAFLNPVSPNAETSFTHDIREAILKKGGQRFVPGSSPRKGICRAGHLRKIEEAHVVHYHYPSPEMMSELTCPIPF